MTCKRHHPHDLAKLGIARTLQGVGLCAGLTVLENVMLGAQPVLRSDPASSFLGLWRSSREERRTAARAMEVLEDLGVAAYADRLPPALPYAVQKQTALARALMAEPRLLLLDEPASGLSETEMASLGLEDPEPHHRACRCSWWNTTWTSSCPCATGSSCLNFGQVIAHGTPDAIRANPEVATAYLGDEVDAGESTRRRKRTDGA